MVSLAANIIGWASSNAGVVSANAAPASGKLKAVAMVAAVIEVWILFMSGTPVFS